MGVTTQALRQPPAYIGQAWRAGRPGLTRINRADRKNRLARGPMLSDSLEPFRLHRRARYHANRVAELSRPVADHRDSDLEVGPSDLAVSQAGKDHDIADIISQAVHKHRLEESYSSSIDEPSSSSTAVVINPSSLRPRAAAAAVGGHPEASSSSSEDASSLQQRIASSGTAGIGPGSSSNSISHNGNSHGSRGSRSIPGYAAMSPQQHPHPLQHSRLPLRGFTPTPPTASPVGAINSSSSSRHDPESELQPLLQPDSPADELLQQQQQMAAAADATPELRGGIPNSIFVLSMVSMALTSASCVFNTLLPIYMVTELKMTMRSMGMFEGMLEAFSYVVRMFSGVVSDRLPSRKVAIAAGFLMGAMAKFGMSFSTSVSQLFIGKAIDRLGNGVQAAPRDALIGDLSPAASRSACFGFAQSMRKCGSFIGAGLAFALMKASGNNYQAIFLLAAGVSLAATFAFALLVPSHPNASREQRQQAEEAAAAAAGGSSSSKDGKQQQQGDGVGQQAAMLWQDVRQMGKDFYRTMGVIALYGMGHINESLLEARAIEVGFGKAESTLVVALLCLSISLCAYPMGRLDDKYGPKLTFALGMASLIAGDLILLLSGSWPHAVFVACLFWGVHWAVVQGPMLAVVVGHAPPHLKGTAFGIFYTVMAVTAMAANSMFGTIWHTLGATSAFGLSAVIISAALVLLPWMLPARGGLGGMQQDKGMKVAPA